MQSRLTAVAVFVLSAIGTAQVFGPATRFTAAGTSASWPSLAEGGLALYVAQNVACGNVLVIRRASFSASWGMPAVVYDENPGAGGARMSEDGLELFAYQFLGGVRQIHRSMRASATVKFPPLQPLTELRDLQDRGPGCLSRDALTLYYWSAGNTLGYAVRPSRDKPFVDKPFVDKGKAGTRPLSWISDDQRVGLTWQMYLVRRDDPTAAFAFERSAGPMTGNIRVGAVTFLPETGEAIFWRDTGNGAHELAIARRGASLVDYSTWKPGGRVDFDIYGRPVDLWILAVAAGPQHVPLPPFGTLGIGTPFVVMGQGAIPSKRLRWSPTQDPFPATFSLNLPVSLPIGTKGYMQALTADRVSQSMGSLTNVVVGMLQ